MGLNSSTVWKLTDFIFRNVADDKTLHIYKIFFYKGISCFCWLIDTIDLFSKKTFWSVRAILKFSGIASVQCQTWIKRKVCLEMNHEKMFVWSYNVGVNMFKWEEVWVLHQSLVWRTETRCDLFLFCVVSWYEIHAWSLSQSIWHTLYIFGFCFLLDLIIICMIL